ncbi:mechanosensitive ion channel family protein [Microbulbifer sp. 2201CG32-9]|uniref:mechanosensitive ion channel family protein n=1 Tax=Microbulbifer sp. 2201CG32-9 TaxID=3232309 RepID=UPI00345C28F0
MVGTSHLFSLSSEQRWRRLLRRCAFAWLGFTFTLFSTLAIAQLPGLDKPAQFQPVVPDFSAPTADWWTQWPELSLQERQQWLEALEEGWREWSKRLPPSAPLQELAQEIDNSFTNIQTTWDKAQEYQQIALLPGIEFPQNPNVDQWAQADAILARARKRSLSVKLETRKLDQATKQSLGKLRQQVTVFRGVGDDEGAAMVAGLTLFLAEMQHLNTIERLAVTTQQLEAWQEEIELANVQLTRMLAELTFSAASGDRLEREIETQDGEIGTLVERRNKLQSAVLLSSDSAAAAENELAALELEVQETELRLEKRKREILLSINSALDPEGGDQSLVPIRELVAASRTVVDQTLRELNLRQRQIASWTSEEPQAMSRWWEYFEKVSGGIARIDDLVKDLERYQTAQLTVFKQRKGWWATVRERAAYFSNIAYSRWRLLADYQLFTISQTPITLRVVARILFVLISAWLLSNLIRRFLNRLVRRKKAAESSMYNLGRVLHYSIIAIALLVALIMLGLDTSKLALVAGALSVGIGFGLQSIFSNFISGLILLFEQPLRVGDLVELESGVFGRIRDINVRSTRITTRDNIDILVPNSELVANQVINHTLDDPVRRIHVPFGVGYSSDPDLVREAAIQAAERVPITHTDWRRKTEVWLMEFGDSALNFKLVVWINSNMVSPLGDPHALYNLELLRAFGEHGIEVPFPQRDLHLRSWDAPLSVTRQVKK